jgi:hypothetical protein
LGALLLAVGGDWLSAGSFRLMPVMLNVKFGRLCGMMRSVGMMPEGGVGVVSGRFVVPCFVMLGCFAMMPRRMFVMFGGFVMMLCCMHCHGSSSEK